MPPRSSTQQPRVRKWTRGSGFADSPTWSGRSADADYKALGRGDAEFLSAVFVMEKPNAEFHAWGAEEARKRESQLLQSGANEDQIDSWRTALVDQFNINEEAATHAEARVNYWRGGVFVGRPDATA